MCQYLTKLQEQFHFDPEILLLRFYFAYTHLKMQNNNNVISNKQDCLLHYYLKKQILDENYLFIKDRLNNLCNSHTMKYYSFNIIKRKLTLKLYGVFSSYIKSLYSMIFFV